MGIGKGHGSGTVGEGGVGFLEGERVGGGCVREGPAWVSTCVSVAVSESV